MHINVNNNVYVLKNKVFVAQVMEPVVLPFSEYVVCQLLLGYDLG